MCNIGFEIVWKNDGMLLQCQPIREVKSSCFGRSDWGWMESKGTIGISYSSSPVNLHDTDVKNNWLIFDFDAWNRNIVDRFWQCQTYVQLHASHREKPRSWGLCGYVGVKLMSVLKKMASYRLSCAPQYTLVCDVFLHCIFFIAYFCLHNFFFA